ncbi:uncharacterized protein EAF02_005935 [Botrytis sinoallii]|uniref:uncharacterized protein n=1 Tax=Botrytis sinoallii TaxID=1463999 RepID=UPI0018FF6C6D|nr:uncharacterized protein EAF02_005935 [Botrytis sinoallii]KAF7882572.1 hypothetical protein EAF02_005935 [Botrytis sinoallii]
MPQPSEVESDGKPIALPPRALLEVTLEFYLKEIDDPLPIFDRDTLLKAIDEQYSIGYTLLKPRIASSQALFTLSFVTREFYDHQVAAKHIALAHQMARSIGLHQPGQFISPERTNLFWSMYIIDKLRLFRCSQVYRSYLLECSVPLPEFDQPSPLEIVFLAKIKMACFLEEIYTELYMNHTEIKPYSSGQSSAMRLLVQLDQEWPDFHAQAAILKESYP